MPAKGQRGIQPGEQLWKLRTTYSRKAIKTPQRLAEKCIKYFEWAEKNPIREEKVFQYEGKPVYADVTKMRALTIQGLQIHSGIQDAQWDRFKTDHTNQPFVGVTDEKRAELEQEAAESGEPTFADVVAWAEAIIREQKFTGAAAGVLNPVIIARDLGLAEKSEHDVGGGLKELIIKDLSGPNRTED